MKLTHFLSASLLLCAPAVLSAQTTPQSEKESKEINSRDVLMSEQEEIENFREKKSRMETSIKNNDPKGVKELYSQLLTEMKEAKARTESKMESSKKDGKGESVRSKRQQNLKSQDKIIQKFESMEISGEEISESQKESIQYLIGEFENTMIQEMGVLKIETN